MKATQLSQEYLTYGEQLCGLQQNPSIAGLYLPAPVPDETFRDEFGFVFLDDGSVGPFYVSLGTLLQTLWQRYPDPDDCRMDARSTLQGLAETSLADRALAIGAYNALSASFFRATGYAPPDRPKGRDTTDIPDARPIGMVGYFCPLVDKLTEQGRRVLVLEDAPARVPDRPLVSLASEVRQLRECSQVLCSASTLVNDSLEAILTALGDQVAVELIGPTGSGLPDPLLSRGVSAVGGIAFTDRQRLAGHLQGKESWGKAGRKYQLEAGAYPGFQALRARLSDHPAQNRT